MNLIKLTDSDGYTREYTHWRPGKKLTLPIKNNPRLCTSDVIHAYKSLNLALLVNPIQAGFDKPKIFKATGEICIENKLKVGCFELTILEEIEQPEWYKDIRRRRKVQIQFARLCVTAVAADAHAAAYATAAYATAYAATAHATDNIDGTYAIYVAMDAAVAAMDAAVAAKATNAAIDFNALADEAVQLQG